MGGFKFWLRISWANRVFRLSGLGLSGLGLRVLEM